MCHPLSSVRSPLPNRGFPVRRLPLAVAAVCLFACGEDSEPPEACGSMPLQTLGLEQEVGLVPCFEDPEGEELKLTASSSDVDVATAAAQDSAISVKGVSPGSATIAVVATDPAGQTARQEFGVAVLDGRPPEVCETILPHTLLVGTTLLVQPCFEDPDGEQLKLTASSSNTEVATVIVLAGAVRIKGVAPGSAAVTIVATDPDGLAASLDIEVTVVNPG